MTLGQGPFHPRHHRKDKQGLAPHHRRNTEWAVQHSAAVRAKSQLLKASISRRDNNMRFMALRPDLLDTPIPGLEGATDTDRYALSVQEVTPSPRTGIVFSSVPTQNHDSQPGDRIRPFSTTPPPPSVTASSSRDRLPEQHFRAPAEDSSHLPFSMPCLHPSPTSNDQGGQRLSPLNAQQGGVSSPHQRVFLSPVSQPLPSPLNHHASQSKRWGWGDASHTPWEPSGGLFQSSPFSRSPLPDAEDLYAGPISVRSTAEPIQTQRPSHRGGGRLQQTPPMQERRRFTAEPAIVHIRKSRDAERPPSQISIRDREHQTLSSPSASSGILARTLDIENAGQLRQPTSPAAQVRRTDVNQREPISPRVSQHVWSPPQWHSLPQASQENTSQVSRHSLSSATTHRDTPPRQHVDNAERFEIPDHDEDVGDLVMEDSPLVTGNEGAGYGNDPYRRLSALEDQFERQSRKWDATNVKLDLLCDLIQHLKGSEPHPEGETPQSSPHFGGSRSQDCPAPALLVLGSRSDSRANQSQPQGQGNVITRRRARSELQIERAIDAHWKKLMSTYRLPEPAVVKGYRLENGKACSTTTFQPDPRETVRSAWNTSVVEVFVDSLFSSNHPHIPTPPTHEMRTTVFRLAFSQLRSWREKQRLTPDEEKVKLREKRRYERRRQSYFRRMNIASLHTDTRRHLDMLFYLGPDGMSSDESDHEKANGIPQYRIKPKSWRHPNLVRCVRVLDALHRKDRFQECDDTADCERAHPVRLTAGPGAPTHLRVEGGSESTRKPKKGLPDCLYNPELLKKPEAERLQAIPSEVYDFSHTANIIQMALPKNGDASSLGPFPEL